VEIQRSRVQDGRTKEWWRAGGPPWRGPAGAGSLGWRGYSGDAPRLGGRRSRSATRAHHAAASGSSICDLQDGGEEMTATYQDKGTVIVTGASRGIGAAIAGKLADDGYGVIVNYAADSDGAESVVSAIRARGGRAEPARAGGAAAGAVA